MSVISDLPISFPSRKNENFRYVSLQNKAWEIEPNQSNAKILPRDWNDEFVEQGSRYLQVAQSSELKTSLNDEHSKIQIDYQSQDLFEHFKGDYFAELAKTNCKTVSIINVPNSFASKKVLRLTELMPSESKNMFSRVCFNIGDNVDLSVLNDLQSEDIKSLTQAALVSAVHMNIGANSRVHFFVEQELSPKTTFVLRHSANISQDSTLTYWANHNGAQRGQHRVETIVTGERAHSKISFGVRAKGEDAIDLWSQSYHNVKNTTSDTTAWNVLEDKSTVVFNGTINIGNKGFFTQAYQSNKNLILSDHAQAHSMPKLEIATDDVKCSHGATMSSLDPDHLFYLQSRGVDAKTAETMLINAFSYPVLSQIPLVKIRRRYISQEEEVSLLG